MKRAAVWLLLPMLFLLASCASERPVAVALIDSGISTRAIAAEKLLPGENYVAPGAGTEDTYGHGTAMASILVSRAPQARLVPLVDAVYEDGRLLRADAETMARMLRDAVDVYGCGIICICGGIETDHEALREAVRYALGRGAVIVAAAGNDYPESPGKRCYPAAYDGVISVGALDADGEIAGFSQRWAERYAPGVDVPVLLMSGRPSVCSGTSCAAAIVAAELANGG